MVRRPRKHIFSPFYLDTPEDHVKHVKTIIDTLRANSYYLGANKLILGHIINDSGTRLDPHKVDKIISWKTPTSKELLMQFIGSVGYLTAGCATQYGNCHCLLVGQV
ncbi:hypothetical protein CY34DRAFT_98402 [Suillus luteus UH-Slu-Lm8-n1]|uniref:Uncharacterized protein n=1 Tax=Suillus luteus UH-Slu-Lm8-n1 TaxID=930992 RepID=A0A0C9Z9P6_9AGAM|nr:hypothetical protein CY34DRAFT_98402 [Suillus luteus UH-Slu-Lm8-n1]